MEHLLWSLRFYRTGNVVMQNARVLKSGYEESYFARGMGRLAMRCAQTCKSGRGGRRTSLDKIKQTTRDFLELTTN